MTIVLCQQPGCHNTRTITVHYTLVGSHPIPSCQQHWQELSSKLPGCFFYHHATTAQQPSRVQCTPLPRVRALPSTDDES